MVFNALFSKMGEAETRRIVDGVVPAGKHWDQVKGKGPLQPLPSGILEFLWPVIATFPPF